MIRKDIKEVLYEQDWHYLVKNFLPITCVDTLSFVEAMHLVGQLIKAAENEPPGSLMTDFFRDFLVNLMIILRARSPKEWERDWKNEAFLGIACAFVYREEEAFFYIKNAYEKLKEPPQSLILAYIIPIPIQELGIGAPIARK